MKKNGFITVLFFSFFFALLTACSGDPKKNSSPENSVKKNDVIKTKSPSSFSDTLLIDRPSAVFYNPDSIQLRKIKEQSFKNVYETDVHNCFYLMRNARRVIKKYWPRVHIIETSINRYLLFIKSDKTKTYIDLDSRGDMCGIFLFNGEKEPELADMMNIDTALGFYFEK